MEIYGLQKLTLLDYPNMIACSIFLGGCPFRCPYCHNYELVDGSAKPIMTEEELFDFLQERKGMLDGVVITGGEPCMHPDLPEFIIKIRELGYKIKLDTNGYYPEMLQKLIDEKLVDYIAMDIKNSPGFYPETVGVEDVDYNRVKKSIDILMNSGIDYEFRTTVVKEFMNQFNIIIIGMLVKGAKRYFLQPFVDRESVPFSNLSAPDMDTLYYYRDILKEFVDHVEIRGV